MFNTNFKDIIVTYSVGRQTTKKFVLNIFVQEKNDMFKRGGELVKFHMGWWGLKFADVIY